MTFPTLGRWTVGVRLGRRSWRLAPWSRAARGRPCGSPSPLVEPDGALLLADRAAGRISGSTWSPATVPWSPRGSINRSPWPSTARAAPRGRYARDLPRRSRWPGSRRGERDARPYGRRRPGDGSLARGSRRLHIPARRPHGDRRVRRLVRVVRTEADRHDRRERIEGYTGDGGRRRRRSSGIRTTSRRSRTGRSSWRTATTRDPAIGPDGRIRTVVSSLSAPVDLAAAPGGGFVIGDAAGTVYRIAADGPAGRPPRAARA